MFCRDEHGHFIFNTAPPSQEVSFTVFFQLWKEGEGKTCTQETCVEWALIKFILIAKYLKNLSLLPRFTRFSHIAKVVILYTICTSNNITLTFHPSKIKPASSDTDSNITRMWFLSVNSLVGWQSSILSFYKQHQLGKGMAFFIQGDITWSWPDQDAQFKQVSHLSLLKTLEREAENLINWTSSFIRIKTQPRSFTF